MPLWPALGAYRAAFGSALTLEELESAATEDELAAEIAAAKTRNTTTTVASFTRKRPSRQPFPDHLPRERVIVPGPVARSCCGGSRLSKLGEDITETLEVIPKSWKVIFRPTLQFSAYHAILPQCQPNRILHRKVASACRRMTLKNRWYHQLVMLTVFNVFQVFCIPL
jgi:hypothetical protein